MLLGIKWKQHCLLCKPLLGIYCRKSLLITHFKQCDLCLYSHRHENEVVPKVVEAILNMPETVHINMRYTSVMLLGELCEWISHEQHSETLGIK